MADLIERLLAVESGEEGTNWYRNPDGPEAAARIAEMEVMIATACRVLKPIADMMAPLRDKPNYRYQTSSGARACLDAFEVLTALPAPDTGGADGE